MMVPTKGGVVNEARGNEGARDIGPKRLHGSILGEVNDDRPDPMFGGKVGFIPFAFHKLPRNGLAKAAAVMRDGQRKGRRDDWREVPIQEHINHAMAHLYAYMDGDHTRSHLANAVCRVLMAADLDRGESHPKVKFEMKDPKPPEQPEPTERPEYP